MELPFLLPEMVNAQYKLKQGFQESKPSMHDLLIKVLIIPIPSSFNNLIWPGLKLGKKKWFFIVEFLNTDAKGHSLILLYGFSITAMTNYHKRSNLK